jgi:hypothetical protein
MIEPVAGFDGSGLGDRTHRGRSRAETIETRIR